MNNVNANQFLELMKENEGKKLTLVFNNNSFMCQYNIDAGWKLVCDGYSFGFNNSVLTIFIDDINYIETEIEYDIQLNMSNGLIYIDFE